VRPKLVHRYISIRFFTILLFLLVGCSQRSGEQEETTHPQRDYLRLLEEKRAIERENRQLALDLELSRQDSLYGLIDLHERRIHLKMRGVSLKDYEIRRMTVRLGSEGTDVDRWLKQPLAVLVKKEITRQNAKKEKEEEWQEITVTAQAERDTVMAKALWDTTVGSYSIRKRAFSVVPDSSLPTSYDLHTDQDVVLSVRTERDLSVVPVGFSAWVTSTADVIQRVIAKLMGQLTTDQVQVVLDEGDARAVFRSLQVGTQIILIP